VFFVISGYLMARMFDEGTPAQFYGRRIRRLVPAYAVTIVVTLIAASFLTVPVDFAQATTQSLFAAGFISNLGFWLQSSYFSKAEFNPLLNLWSLGVEMQFYLLIPFLYAFLKPRKRGTILLLALSFAACLAAASISAKTAFFHTPFRVWEFLIGAYIAWYLPQKKQVGGTVQSACLILLVAALLTPLKPNTLILGMDPGLANLTVCLLAGTILAFGMPHVFEKSLFGKTLNMLGRYSYSIYLVHFPIIVLFNYIPFGGTVLGTSSALAFVTLLALIFLAAALLYHLVEQQNAFIFAGKRPLLLLMLAITIAIGFSLQNGARYSAQEKNLFAAWTDQGTYRCGKLFRLLHPMASICEITKGKHLTGGRLLLVGNSHADAIKQSFTKAFSEQGVRVYFYVPNDPLVHERYNGDAVLADIKRLNIDAVVIHFDLSAYNDHLVGQIERLAASLKAQGIPMRIISPVPHYPYHVPRTLFKTPGMTLGKELQDYYPDTHAFWDHFPSKSVPRRDIIDTGPVFCQPACKVADRTRRSYYIDFNHLTLTGAALLEPTFDRMAEEIFAK